MKLENILNATIGRESFCVPKEMVINGSFLAETSGQVAGTVNGDVLVKGKIVILKEGIVNGDISADELVVYGRLTGDVRSCSKMVIHSGAIVSGNITATEIHTDKDAIIEGLIVKSGMPVSAESRVRLPAKTSSPFRENYKMSADNSESSKHEAWF
ncbi:MAG: polymer-forming cytoskeletal protein [Chitinophagaceae bacterium]